MQIEIKTFIHILKFNIKQMRNVEELAYNWLAQALEDISGKVNEFCREKFDFKGKTKKEASEYISRNIEEYKLATMDNWQIAYM